MQCSKCQFENPEDSNFCLECGQKLEQNCPQCKKQLPAGAKFCNGCGHNLKAKPAPPAKELSFDEKLTKIQKYLPKGLTEKILSQRNRIEGERKQVTVMFCDMEGFTGLVEKLSPEAAYEIMDKVYEILIHKVHNYEGTVNEMTGDGIMALFGAPIALEDAPQRAIRSALAVHREMAKFNDKFQQERKNVPPLKMRIGVHTGPVVVGTLGNDLRVEFKAVGDTVNLASRMESLAEPGTSYVTGETFKLTEGYFRFEGLGTRQVKGREEPVNVYRVIAPSSRRTRFDVSTERGLTHFVGRERELELLLDGFKRAKSGRGQAFSIIAEAGVGKSRLLYEFRKAVANEGVTFLEGKCLSYSRGVAYHPVMDILKANFDIREGDGDSEVKEKVKRQLKVLRVDKASTLPYLLELLSVKDSGIDQIAMSPEGRKDRIMEALNQIVLKGSEIRPLIMAIEDLHWIDKGSEDVFKNLLNSIAGAKVFLIFTYRPEFVHAWGGKSFHSQVNLNRFSNRESLAMVAHLLGIEEIDSGLGELILEKTEGVPFFIEELIKSLKDLNIIERIDDRYFLTKDIQDVVIPSTIQDVIMARVDSLPEVAKEVLQTGSVIEREFSYELLKRVTGLQEQILHSHLSVLKDSELIYERGIYPHTAYIFKHALTREVVYDSILTRKKNNFHVEIGNAIEELYKENIVEYYGVIAEHYIAGENYEKGAEYSRFASKKAAKTGSLNGAIEQAEKRIACLEKLPQSENVQKTIIDARTALGLYYIQISYFIEAKEAVDPIIDLALRHGYKRRLSQIYTIIGVYKNWVKEDLPEALKHLEEALNISQEIGDDVSLFFSNLWFGCSLSWNCEFQKGFYCLEKALNINVAANRLWGISVVKSLISYMVYYFQGKLNLSYQTSDEAICIAEESGDIFSKSMAYINHGICCYGKGFFEKATEHLLKGVDFCERINYFNWNSVAEQVLGDICFEIGEYQKSKEHYSRAISLLEHGGFWPSLINLNKIALARTEVMSNEKAIYLKSLYEYAAANKMKSCDGMMARYISAILLNIDDHHLSEAGDWINKAIEMDKQNGMMWHLGQDYSLYAELFKRKNDQSKTKENLNKAIEIFKECGADGWVLKYEKEFAALQ
jgi:class 3 adenylate cyclase/tetratricopeptide (TPR) repeat protein